VPSMLVAMGMLCAFSAMPPGAGPDDEDDE